MLSDRLRLAGQRRFLGTQLLSFDQSRIRSDEVAGLQQEYIAADDFRRRNHQGMTITDHARPRRYKMRQCRRCAFCPKLLIESEQRIQENDDGDCQPVDGFAQTNR